MLASGTSSLFVDADLMTGLDRVTGNSGGTVQFQTADNWVIAGSVGTYTLYEAGNGQQR